MKKYWTPKEVEKVFENDLFSIYHKKYLLNPRKIEGIFATIITSDWVNVIPVADDGNFILIKQFRHGIEGTTVEIPGGGVDTTDEDPLAAAIRELREETGYRAREWEYLGEVTPNPAIQNNYCYTYLARGLEKRVTRLHDQMEYIKVFQARPVDVKEMLRDGTISHALVLAAFSHYLLKGYLL